VKIWNQDEGVLDTRVTATHEAHSGQPAGTTCMSGFKLFQKDVKSVFLYGVINEEVFVSQPPRFEDHQHPKHVYKLKKALYGLKQAPKPWYDRLSNFLLSHDYKRGKVDKTLFIIKSNYAIILSKYMLMTLFLVLLMIDCVKNLWQLCRENLKCQ